MLKQLGISAIGNIIGNVQQSANINKQISAQSSENSKIRAFNYMLARKQNEWNLEQWNRENEYNLPANQMKRFADAGLNPDLIYSQSNLSASSPSMTSGALATPTDMSNIADKPTFSELINNTLNSVNQMEVIKNVGADTDKKRSEIVNIDSETAWRDVLNVNTVKLGSVEYRLKESEIPKNKAQCESLIAGVRHTSKLIEEIDSKIANINKNTEFLDEQIVHERVKKSLTQRTIEEVSSRIRLNNEQAESILVTTTENILMNRASLIRLGKENILLEMQAGQVRMSTPTDEELKARRDNATLESHKVEFSISGKHYESDVMRSYHENYASDVNTILNGVNTVLDVLNPLE